MTTTRERIMAHEGVEEMWSEMNSEDSWGRPKKDWWVGLKSGWCVPEMECHTIHEDTQAECLRLVRDLVRCGCKDCAEFVDTEMDTSGCRCWDKAPGRETPMRGPLYLGHRQAEWIDWALDPMLDYWTDPGEAEGRDGAVMDEEVLPILTGRKLEIDHCPDEVLDDLIYRILEQGPDMAEQEEDASSVYSLLALGKRLVAEREKKQG